MPNFPATLDTNGAGSLPTNHADGISEIIHASTIDDLATVAVAIETKVGSGASTPSSGMVLTGGSVTGTSSWQVPQSLGNTGGQATQNLGNAGGRFGQQFSLLAALQMDTCIWASQLTLAAQAGQLSMPTSVAGLPEATAGMVTAAQNAITAATAGAIIDLTTVVSAGPGIYRTTFTGPVNTGVTVVGRGQISVRGSDNWSTGGTAGNTWAVSGSNYLSSLTLPALTAEVGLNSTVPVLAGGTHLYDATNRWQLYIDGVPQRHVSSGSTLAAGQWKFVTDFSDQHVLLFSNPSGKVVEVTVRATWATTLATSTTWDGIDWRHGTSGNNQFPCIQNSSIAGLTFQHCMLGYVHGCILAMGGATGCVVRDSVLHNAGTAAVQGNICTGAAFIRNVVFSCGGALRFTGDVQDFAGYDYTWGSGGFKIAQAPAVLFLDNWLFNMGWSPLWSDIAGAWGGRFTNNRIWDFRLYGIHIEISDWSRADNNVIFQTNSNTWYATGGQIGIHQSSSRNVDIDHNIVLRMPIGIKMFWDQTRSDLPPGLFVNNRMYENIVVGRKSGGGLATTDVFWQWADQAGTGANINAASNKGWNNYYGLPGTNVANVYTWADDYLWYSALGGLTAQDASKYWLNVAAVIQARWENGNSAIPGGTTTLTRMLSEAERVSYLLALGCPLVN